MHVRRNALVLISLLVTCVKSLEDCSTDAQYEEEVTTAASSYNEPESLLSNTTTAVTTFSLSDLLAFGYVSSLVGDLRLAFSLGGKDTSSPTRKRRGSPRLQESRLFSRQEQKVMETKCRVRPGRLTPGDQGAPVPPPTGSTTIVATIGTSVSSIVIPLPTQTVGEGHGGGGTEIIAVTTPCGDIPVGAQVEIGETVGPNGSIEWLTCGINPDDMYNSTWQPPYASIDQIIMVEGGLPAALRMEGTPYRSCDPYVGLFEAAGAEFNIPPLFLAAFALQESGCNPDIEGQGGEQGMMQLSMDKCDDAPDGNCRDAWYNVRTAARFFRGVLDGNGGNVIESVGLYNGWFRGMSFYEATTWGIYHNCCRCQRNLDYLHQMFNGWLLGRSAWETPRLGSFFNVDICNE